MAGSEDRKIRRFLAVGAAIVMAGLLGIGLIITVMISANFNPLNWLE